MIPERSSWVPRIARVARAGAGHFTDGEPQGAVLGVIADELAPVTRHPDGVHLYLADLAAHTLNLADARGALPRELAFDAEHFVARTAATRRPARDGADLGLPLLLGPELVGVLALTFAMPDEVPDSDLQPLQAMADILALALGGARAETRKQEISTRIAQANVADRVIVNALEVVPESQLHVALMRGFHLWPYAREENIPEFLRSALTTIVEQARAAVHAEIGALGIGRNSDVPFDPWVYSGVPEEQAKAVGRNPRPVGTLGAVAMGGQHLRTRDVHAHPVFRGLPPHHPDVTSMLAIPIHYGDVNVGNLYLANKIGAPEFTAEDQSIVERIAMHVGQALQIAFLRTAIEAERAQLQSTLDCAPNGILFIDAANQHVMANPRAMQLVGRTIIPAAGVAQYIDLLRRPDGRPVSIDELPFQAALTGETVRNVEALICRADGKRCRPRRSARSRPPTAGPVASR